MTRFTILAPFAFLVGCSSMIPNTTVEDTSENREVVSFVEEYRHAVEERNVRRLLELASPRYLDDNGTPGGEDDLDFDTLREKLSLWSNRVTDVRYEIKYRRVSYDTTRIFVEFRYTASFRVATGDGGERWARRLGDHRLILTREEGEAPEGELRILAGM
ncbi:MAG: hypothetical protein H6721_10600 [Sandaracinus sp.]|nr:hypothetical protein [Sandaracinus sp.]MCB9614883.1 hypothetical protein [Sandaracinus sp.]MCB9618635.1 hypothetical protein [Sandaracinus sp.]MCB9632568.1 hypothetical protein [Sandaracinus sp.]